MKNRRDVLAALIGGIGLSGCTESLPVASGPATNEEIDTITFDDRSHFQSVTFYRSGGTEILLEEEHPGQRIGFTHDKLDMQTERFATWEAPRFAGPLVVEMKSIVKNNGPYPNNEFKMEILAGEDSVLFSAAPTPRFQVPPTYYPNN